MYLKAIYIFIYKMYKNIYKYTKILIIEHKMYKLIYETVIFFTGKEIISTKAYIEVKFFKKR